MSLLESLGAMYFFVVSVGDFLTEDVLISVFIITPSMLHLPVHLT